MRMRPRRVLVTALFACITGLLYFSSRYNRSSFRRVPKTLTVCNENVAWLEPYQFTYPIRYASRNVMTRLNPRGERPGLTVVDAPLFPDFLDLDLSETKDLSTDYCFEPIVLEVPHPRTRRVDASNIVFGLQTTLQRLKATVKHLERWLPDSGARLYAIVVEREGVAAMDSEMAALQKQFHNLGMNVTIMHPVRPDDTFAQRYFSLVDVMYNARDEKTEWVTAIDDDTFFPSMWDLQAMLAKHDKRDQVYLGSLSEDWWAVNHYGLMAFGGAGIFISVPLAQTIHNSNDYCRSLDHLRLTSGDAAVMDCVYRFSTAKLTNIPELHQVDMKGDLSGFYESGRPMLTLHHWKEGSAAGYKLEMEKMHLVADVCGSCFLQRWQFANDMILSNGYSIAQYPKGQLSGYDPEGLLGTGVGPKFVDKLELESIEETWEGEINVQHSLAPTRPRLDDREKLSFKLLDSMVVEDGRVVRQVYFKEGNDGHSDTVMVLNWYDEESREPVPTPPPGQATRNRRPANAVEADGAPVSTLAPDVVSEPPANTELEEGEVHILETESSTKA